MLEPALPEDTTSETTIFGYNNDWLTDDMDLGELRH